MGVSRGYEMKRPVVLASKLTHTQGSLAGKVVVVTGANRGLGLGFVKALVQREATVIACCRNPESATELKTVLENGQNTKSFAVCLDVTSALAKWQDTESVLKSRGIGAVDVLINNAGVSSKNHPDDPIVSADAEEVQRVFNTNVIGTIQTTQAFLPLLRSGPTKLVINLSSEMASIENCLKGGKQGISGDRCSYRLSRAAGNTQTRCWAAEMKGEGFVFVALSPGHVDTDMGSAGGRKPPLSVGQSVDGMLSCMEKMTDADNG